MSNRIQKPVTVQLVGGLGNQLFGYFAGRYVSHRLGVALQLDMSQFDKGITAHGSDIRAFSLDEKIVNLRQETRFPVLVWQNAMNLTANKIPATRNLVERILGIHTAVPIGVDPRIKTVKPGMLMRGYYQSFRYVWEVVQQPEYQPFQLKQPSNWFAEMSEQARATPTVMIHVRRGDYAKPENVNFGMLSASYYANALGQLREALGARHQVWVFSDEIDKVREELHGHLQGNVKFIEPPAGTIAAESMMLMSLGAGIIISNSTFSWWSAILNPEAKVVAPTSWFKANEDPEDLIPGSWLRQESVWK